MLLIFYLFIMCKCALLTSHTFLLFNSGSGRIVNTYATDFEALATNGMVVVEIENTGDISAEFSVSRCC